MWMQNSSCTFAPPCVHTGCCVINATMRKRHCTHTTRNKQKTTGTLQSCTNSVFYVAAMHRFTVALISCTTFLAFQNLLFPQHCCIPTPTAPCPFNQNSATVRNQAATPHALLYQHTIQRSALAQACHGQCVPVAHHGAMLAFNVSRLPTQSIAANSLQIGRASCRERV